MQIRWSIRLNYISNLLKPVNNNKVGSVSSQIQKTVLENGIRVLSDRVPGVRSVSVGVLIDVGSKDELPEERGYAHLVEHMLFQGTGLRDAGAIAEMMEIGGGVMGAFTARDYTVYHATVLDEYLTFALEVLGDMLCNSVLPAEALDRQRSVILNEIAGSDGPLEQVNNLLKAVLWKDHPLGYPTAGLKSTIKNATRDTLMAFFKKHYSADKIIVTAAGNVDHENFVAQTRDSFWQLPKVEKPIEVVTTNPPKTTLGTVIIKPRDLQQVYFSMAWPAPSYTDAERYGWHVFTSLFGGGVTSRLYRHLREELGIVYHADAQYHAYRDAGTLVVEGATPPETLVPAIASTIIELLKMIEESISPDEHHRTVQSLISQHLISGDSAYVRMSRLALQELYFKGALESERVIKGLKLQSLEAIQEIAQKVCELGIPTISLVGSIDEMLIENLRSMLNDFGGDPTIIMATESQYEVLDIVGGNLNKKTVAVAHSQKSVQSAFAFS